MTHESLQYIPELIRVSENTENLFGYLSEHERDIEQELPTYRESLESAHVSPFGHILASSLNEYFASDIRLKDHKHAQSYAGQIIVGDGKVPWLISLLQSLCHLRMDNRDIKRSVLFQDKIAVLVSIYNETAFTELCLKSIRMWAGCPHYIVAVNNSTIDMSEFKAKVQQLNLVDEWLDTKCTNHGSGLQKALACVKQYRFVATLDCDAIGIAKNWLADMLNLLKKSNAALIGPIRYPASKDIISDVTHPCCMIFDQKYIETSFQINLRGFWPYWDTAALLSWDCKSFKLPVVNIDHEYKNFENGTYISIVNNNVWHLWYTTRILTMQDNDIINDLRVGDIRASLKRIMESPELNELGLYTLTAPVNIDSDLNLLPIDLFERAQKEFALGNFVSAVKYCKQYRSLVDYEKFVRIVEQTDTSNIDISVVVVTYKRSDDVRKAMEALRNQNAQGCKYEVIIIDNGQSDPAQYKGLYEQYICCPINFNLSEGRNIGVHFAHGKIVVFLDDDALVKPDYIASMKAAFDQYELIGLRGRAFPKSHQQANDGISIYNLGETPFPTYCNQEGNSAFRRDAYVAVGGMDPLLFGHEGSDLSWRIMQAYGQTNRIIYWPAAVIYHDFGNGEKVRYKRMLHQRSSLYLKYKYGVDIFADRHAIESDLPIPRTIADIEWLGPIKPKVSIVIACHDCAQFLGECIESIRRQTLTEWELFLLDDNSSDGTQQIIQNYAAADNRVRAFYFDDNQGPYVRRNFAIEQATSKFILIHDADDIMAEHKLETFYNEIASDQNLGIVGSFYRTFIETYDGIDCTEAHELPMSNEEILDKFVSSRYITWHGSAIIRKSLFETIGLFDKHPYGSDKLWLAMAGEYARHTGHIKIKNIPEYLTFKREHSLSQQGLLPPLDPKSRRARFQTYWEEKLSEVRQKASEAGGDIAALLRQVDCSDYISRFEHLFEQWENQPLHPADLYRFINRAISQLSKEEYVSCIITLDSVCRMVKEIERSYIDLDFMRAIAYFALAKDAACSKYFEREIANHKSQKAQDFIARYLSKATELTADQRKKIVANIICSSDGTVAPDYQIDIKYPALALLNAKRSYGENPDSVRTTFMLGSFYMQLGKFQEAAALLQKTLSLLITQLTSLSPADSEETGERLGECFTSACTKLAQCYMQTRQYGKIKTVYNLLLNEKGAKLSDDQRPAIQRIAVSLDKVSAEQVDIGPAVAPAVTVVMPAYNVQDFIADAIRSVLSQSYKDFELIVIDDGSTDLTVSIVNSFDDMRIRYIYKTNGGLASARNAAIACARGQIIMLLDSDDMMAPDFIEKHVQALRLHTDVDLVYCDDQLVNMDCSPLRRLSQLEYEDDRQLVHDLFCCGYPVIPFRTAMRSSVFDRIGVYDESLKIAEDYDMIRRFVRAGLKRLHLGEPLYIRRVRPNSLSRAQDEEKSKAHFEVIRRFIDAFGYDELFPDVNWNSIEKDRRPIVANYLIASVYRALAHNYCKSNVPYNAALALGCAVALLKENLRIDSDNGQAKILLDQCENEKSRLYALDSAGTCSETAMSVK